MTITKTVPATQLTSLDLKQGDMLHVLSAMDAAFIIQINREEDEPAARRGKASDWLRNARGSVRLQPGETADDARMAFYTEKYGLAN